MIDFFFSHLIHKEKVKQLSFFICSFIGLIKRSHSHLVQQYAMNRSKIDQGMKIGLALHWYLYSWFEITSSKRRDWCICYIQQTN